MEKYSMAFADQLKEKSEIFFYKIDGKVLEDDITAGKNKWKLLKMSSENDSLELLCSYAPIYIVFPDSGTFPFSLTQPILFSIP